MEATLTMRGSPEEISEALKHLMRLTDYRVEVIASEMPLTATAQSAAPEGDEDDFIETPQDSSRVFMDLPACRNMLRGRPLNLQQIALLNELYHAKGWVTAPELQEKLGISIRAFPGFMGGFGLRVTRGKHNKREKAPIFFDLMKVQGVMHYRLPKVAKRAMRLEKIVEHRS